MRFVTVNEISVIGKQFGKYRRTLDLKSGISLATLRDDRKMPNERKQLKNSAKQIAMRSETNLRRSAGMLSGPIAFLTFRFDISIIRSFAVDKLRKIRLITVHLI
ncbi:uncharacterized protein LOC120336478 [Styela clava]